MTIQNCNQLLHRMKISPYSQQRTKLLHKCGVNQRFHCLLQEIKQHLMHRIFSIMTALCITDPNYLFLLLFLLGTVFLSFITLDSNNNIQVVRGSVWLVRTVESKAYLREYNVIGARFCIYR